jgi:hypothetical protein
MGGNSGRQRLRATVLVADMPRTEDHQLERTRITELESRSIVRGAGDTSPAMGRGLGGGGEQLSNGAGR